MEQSMPFLYMYTLLPTNIHSYADLLNTYKEEEIYLHYLKEDFVIDKLIRSPFEDRDDSTASFNLKYLGDRLIWYDFGDHKTGFPKNVVGFVMRKFGIDNPFQAIKKIAEDMKSFNPDQFLLEQALQKREEKTNLSKKGVIIKKDFDPYDLDFWHLLYVTRDLLKEYSTYAAKETYIEGRLWRKSCRQDPIFVYLLNNDRKNPSMQWYRPLVKNRAVKFRDHNTKEAIFGLKQLPPSGEKLIITKSAKDVLTLRAMGFWAICPMSESAYLFLVNVVLPELIPNWKKIFIMYDPDKTGDSYAELITNLVNNQITKIDMPKEFEKDPSDTVMAGKREEFINFLNHVTQ